MDQVPTVSVCMITYNHEAYIAQAIESVLMQKTDFSVELVIGEDCSTDQTRGLCAEYQQRHPDRIRLLPSEKNMGIQANFIRTLCACRGKYIALLEGDDFWTDPSKLQKQVDFLETHETYNLTFHNVNSLQAGKTSRPIYPEGRKTTISITDVFNHDYTQTCSTVFRAAPLRSIPAEQAAEWIYNDVTLFSLVLSKGALGRYFPDVMATYRIHEGGVWSMADIREKYRLSRRAEDILVDKYYNNPGLRKLIAKREAVYYLFFSIEMAKVRAFGPMVTTSLLFLQWCLPASPLLCWKIMLPYLYFGKAVVFGRGGKRAD